MLLVVVVVVVVVLLAVVMMLVEMVTVCFVDLWPHPFCWSCALKGSNFRSSWYLTY